MINRKPLSVAVITIAAVAPSVSEVAVAEEFALEEIVITAQRREQSAQDVPLAVTAVDGEAMEVARVENITNMSALTPSLQFVTASSPASTSNLIIRGLGTVGNTRSFEGAVGVFYDGVYRTRPGAAVEKFLDVGSTQILRGPQGTLFGKNTTAGAVLINSEQPDTGSFSGSYNVGYGNFDTWKAKGALNIPVSENSAIRLAALHTETKGFYEDVNTGKALSGKESDVVKVQWLKDINQDLSIHLIADASDSEGDCCYASVDLKDSPVTSLVDSIILSRGLSLPSDDFGDREAALNIEAIQKITDQGLTLKVNYEIGHGNLTSITAYRKYNVDRDNADPDFHAIDLVRLNEEFDSKFASQEFTFNADIGGSGDVVVGIFYSKEDIQIDREQGNGIDAEFYWDTLLSAEAGVDLSGAVAAAPGTFMVEDMSSEVTSLAVFAHSTYALSDQLTLIAGLRYSEEEKYGKFFYKDFQLDFEGVPNVYVALGLGPGPEFEDTFTDEAVSGVLGLQYHINETMAYLTYNRGFKAGGVILDGNGAGILANNPDFGGTPLTPLYDSEVVDALEFGLKTTYWDGRAQSNMALFFNIVKDIQVAQFIGLQFAVINAEDAELYGLELENTLLLDEGLTLNANVTWLPYAEYGESPTLDPILSGNRMRLAAELSTNLGISYETELSETFQLRINTGYQYVGSRFTSTVSDEKQESYNLLNSTISLISTNSGWQIDLWGQNITNEEYVSYDFSSPAQAGDRNAFLGAPRTYGITLRGEF